MAGTLVIDTLKSSTTGAPVFQNTSGTEIGQLCKAWVNFNGVTTATIRASYNVSSVTRTAAGQYTVNFTNALADANYSVVGGISKIDATRDNNSALTVGGASTSTAQTASLFYINTGYASGGAALDGTQICAAAFR